MIANLTFPHDDIFAAVKQEASLYSIRQSDKDGNPLFENLVLDEAYLGKFRELFFNAQAQIIPILSTRQRNIPDNEHIIERRDFTKDRDFIVTLDMGPNFPPHIMQSVEDAIFNFLKDWILYKWYETKMPDTAATFYLNCMGPDGLSGYKGSIKSLLELQTKPTRRRHQYW